MWVPVGFPDVGAPGVAVLSVVPAGDEAGAGVAFGDEPPPVAGAVVPVGLPEVVAGAAVPGAGVPAGVADAVEEVDVAAEPVVLAGWSEVGVLGALEGAVGAVGDVGDVGEPASWVAGDVPPVLPVGLPEVVSGVAVSDVAVPAGDADEGVVVGVAAESAPLVVGDDVSVPVRLSEAGLSGAAVPVVVAEVGVLAVAAACSVVLAAARLPGADVPPGGGAVDGVDVLAGVLGAGFVSDGAEEPEPFPFAGASGDALRPSSRLNRPRLGSGVAGDVVADGVDPVGLVVEGASAPVGAGVRTVGVGSLLAGVPVLLLTGFSSAEPALV